MDQANQDVGVRLLSSREREAMAAKHLRLVQHLATPYQAAAPHLSDEVFGAGMLGLSVALGRYEPDRGVPFGAYARQAIRGAILDELRQWVPTGYRRLGRTKAVATAAPACVGLAAAGEVACREPGPDEVIESNDWVDHTLGRLRADAELEKGRKFRHPSAASRLDAPVPIPEAYKGQPERFKK